MKKLFSLLTLLLLLCTSAWADQAYHSVTANMAGTDYETYYLFESGAAASSTNVVGTAFSNSKLTYTTACSTWVEGNPTGKDNTGSPGDFSNKGFYKTDKGDLKFNGTSMTFHVTNCVGVAILGKGNADTKPLQISVKEQGSSSEVGAVASTTGNSVTVLAYGTTLTKTKNYDITISSVSGGNSYAYQIRFEAPASVKYAVSYDLNTGTGTTPTETDKAEGATFTLHNGTTGITAPSISKVFAGWRCSIDSKIYAGGSSYTMTAAPTTFTAQWSDIYTVTYQSGEGTGDNVVVSPATIVADCPNTFTAPDGKRFAGWKDAQDHDIAVGATVTSDLTLTAQWEIIPICYSFAPGAEEGSLSVGDVVKTSPTSFGGIMIVQNLGSGAMAYSTSGVGFTSKSGPTVEVTLKNKLKAGSVISMTLVAGGADTRGLNLQTSSGSKINAFTCWVKDVNGATNGEEGTFTYTVEAGDGLVGTNVFRLQRNNTVYLKALTVTNGGDEYAEPVMLKADTWASFCPSFDVTVPAEGSSNVSVNYATFNSSTNVLTTHKLNASGDVKIKAGEGVLLKASAAGLKQFLATTGAEEIDGNVLGGTTERTLTSTLKGSETYLMALNGENTFVSYTGEYFPANKAYFAVTPAGSAPSGIRIVDEESNATSLSDIESTDEGVKFIQNGQLFIKKNGVVYDMLGIVVRK